MSETIFYAWQSDAPNNICRTFIERAAKQALKRIALDLPLENAPRLDQDTKGASGMVSVADTIFEKLDSAFAVIADVTLVGRVTSRRPRPAGTEGKKHAKRKLTPNPNVMLEIGYAGRGRGWHRVIPVMNTAFGAPDDLPFDVRHRRWPITFHLAEGVDANKAEIKENLVAAIERELRNLMNRSGGLAGLTEQRALEIRSVFHSEIRAGRFGRLDATGGAMCLLMIPKEYGTRRLDFSSADRALLRKFSTVEGWSDIGSGPRGRFFENVAAQDGVVQGVARIDEYGAVYTATQNIYWPNPQADRPTTIPSGKIEQDVVQCLCSQLPALRLLQFFGPIYLDLSFLNLRQCRLGVSQSMGSFGRELPAGYDIVPDLVLSEPDASPEGTLKGVTDALRGAIDFMWREFGFDRSANYDAAGVWHP